MDSGLLAENHESLACMMRNLGYYVLLVHVVTSSLQSGSNRVAVTRMVTAARSATSCRASVAWEAGHSTVKLICVILSFTVSVTVNSSMYKVLVTMCVIHMVTNMCMKAGYQDQYQ